MNGCIQTISRDFSFKKEIVGEKVRTMQSAKIRSDNVTGEMYKDLRESISRGLRGYQTAREEWVRAWNVIEEYDRVTKLAAKHPMTRKSKNRKTKFFKVIRNEIGTTRKCLNVNI